MKFNIFINQGMKVPLLLIIAALVLPFLVSGQASQDSVRPAPRVKILKADVILRDMVQPDVQRLVGDVTLQFKEMYLYCDSAWRYDDGRFKTMGNVRLEDSESTMTAAVMQMNPTLQIVEAWSGSDGEVVMKADLGEVFAPKLRYNMERRTVDFDAGGVISQEATRIDFQQGKWVEKPAVFMLGGEVSIIDAQDRILSDSLHLFQAEESIQFLGRSIILSNDSSLEMHCYRGLYNGSTRSGWFGGTVIDGNAWVRQDDVMLQGDSLVLPADSLAPREAWGHVVLRDTTGKWMLEGEQAKQFKKSSASSRGTSFLYGNENVPARLMDASGSDTLFLQADTLQLEAQFILAWPRVKMEQGAAIALCDTLIWNEVDSVIDLRDAPHLWLEGQFLRADSVTLSMRENAPDRLHAWGHVGLMNPAGDSCYQQIAGRDLLGQFQRGKLRDIEISGNAELVYFDAESESETAACGEFNRAACSRLQIVLEGGEAKTIVLLDDPSGVWLSWDSPGANPIIENLQWIDPPRSIAGQMSDSDSHLPE